MASFSTNSSSPHVVLFPFMSKGHTIPILQLAHLLLHRGAAVTIFTTPANHPFISNFLSDTSASIIDLPFPENIAGVPAGVESTDKLPSMSLFLPFATSTKLMQSNFEQVLETLPTTTFMVTDGFLSWTLNSASKLGIPRLVFYGFCNFVGAINQDVMMHQILLKSQSEDQLFGVPSFPWIKLTRNDFDRAFSDHEQKSPFLHFAWEMAVATSNSYGIIVNSFLELEPKFLEYWNRECKPKAWCVGPLCLGEPARIIVQESYKKTLWVKWLDEKLESPVLYVAFGSQSEISKDQIEEIKIGLEESGTNFLWVVGRYEKELVDHEFEERVRGRGMVVREWVDQREILRHESVKGFLSHCGWNSVLESICAKVPILAWPMTADQPLNARMVVEEIKVGLRVETCDGKVTGFVKSGGLEKIVRELMEGEIGKVVRKKVEEVGDAALKAMEGGGSSWRTLNELIREIHAERHE